MDQVETNIQINDPNNNLQENDMDLTTKYICEHLDKSLIIFCNPISGNQEGKIIIETMNHYISKEKYRFVDYQYIKTKNQYEPIKAVFFELIDKDDNMKGQKLLKHVSERCKLNKEKGLEESFCKIKTLIAGGDGTVLSMIDSFVKNGIDIEFCIFGHIPLGTGNDLSNSLGFSNHIDISEGNMDDIYIILLKYYKAKFGKVDIWKIDLQLDPNEGEILMNHKDGKAPLKDEDGNIIRRYMRSFINYVSLGYDARVGYNFDSKRSKSRNMNKCIYFLEGLKKICCRKTSSINYFIDNFTVYDSEENSINQESFFSNYNNDMFNNTNAKEENIIHTEIKKEPKINSIINSFRQNNKIKFQFISKKKLQQNKNIPSEKNKCIVLSGEPCSIIFQNIFNYMSGVKDIWGNGKDQLSIKIKNGTKEEEKKYTDKLLKMAGENQKLDDKMLEVFTFDNGFKTGFENVFSGFAKKIYHGRGPMEIKFFETPKYTKSDREHRIYFNLDGEYFHIVKPILLKIELNRDYLDGQLPFLIGNI